YSRIYFFPTHRSSDLQELVGQVPAIASWHKGVQRLRGGGALARQVAGFENGALNLRAGVGHVAQFTGGFEIAAPHRRLYPAAARSEEHTSELQSRENL